MSFQAHCSYYWFVYLNAFQKLLDFVNLKDSKSDLNYFKAFMCCFTPLYFRELLLRNSYNHYLLTFGQKTFHQLFNSKIFHFEWYLKFLFLQLHQFNPKLSFHEFFKLLILLHQGWRIHKKQILLIIDLFYLLLN